MTTTNYNNEISLNLALNILRALGGDTSAEYSSPEEVWNDINTIYDEKKITFDVEQLIMNITENGTYEYYPTEEIDAYAPVKIDVNVPTGGSGGGSGLDFSTIGYDETTSDTLNLRLQEELNYTHQIVDAYNNSLITGDWFDLGGYPDMVYCPKLAGYVLDRYDHLFYNNKRLKYVPPYECNDVPNDEGGYYPAATSMFENCVSLTEVPQINYSNAYQCDSMFKNSGINYVDIQINYPLSCTEMFKECSNLSMVQHLTENFNGCSSMREMFRDCRSLSMVPAEFNTTDALTEVAYMFAGCNNLQNAPSIYTGSVMDFSGMFSGCGSITSVSLNTTNANNMNDMFGGCSSLQNVEFINGTSTVTDMSSLFGWNSSLIDANNIIGLDTTNMTTASMMFSNCNNLTTIPALNFGNYADAGWAWTAPFSGCYNLQHVGGFINLGAQMGVESFSFADSPLLTAESVTNIINNLYDRATAGFGQATLTFHMGVMGNFTDELYAAAATKGWQIAFQ